MTPPSRRRGSTLTGFRMQLLEVRNIAASPILCFLHPRRRYPYRGSRLHNPQEYPRGTRKDKAKREEKDEEMDKRDKSGKPFQQEPTNRRWQYRSTGRRYPPEGNGAGNPKT